MNTSTEFQGILNQKIPIHWGFFIIVRWRGLEPPRLAAHGPQPCLSANSSTSAQAGRIIIAFMPLSSKALMDACVEGLWLKLREQMVYVQTWNSLHAVYTER